MSIDFFELIAEQIWERHMKIDGIQFSRTIDFLTYMHDLSDVKGWVFCDNVSMNLVRFQPSSGSGHDRNGYTREDNDILFVKVTKELDIIFELAEKETSSQTPDAGTKYLDDAFIERLGIVEGKAIKKHGTIPGWNKIRIAAFVEIMFERNWFREKDNNRKIPNDFAKARYGKTIEVQLQTGKTTDRETHKKQLLQYFR
jgi:hypothetical protein